MIKYNTALYTALSKRIVQRLDRLVLFDSSLNVLAVFQPLRWELASPGVIKLKEPVQTIARRTGDVDSARIESSNYAEAIIDIPPEFGISSVVAGQVLSVDRIEIHFGDEFALEDSFLLLVDPPPLTAIDPEPVFATLPPLTAIDPELVLVTLI
jgi:hypothetical protein